MKHWEKSQIEQLFQKPLLELLFEAGEIQRTFHPKEIQTCTLLSVKTGKCSEDCAYCPQSSRYATGVASHQLLDKQVVLQAAKKAVENKSTHFCLSTAGKQVSSSSDFEKLLEMIREISKLGIRVCCTLGSLTDEQALKLKEAGIFCYNHNIDCSPKFYEKIIKTHTFQDRLNTLNILQKHQIKICCGGIIGMGETLSDRIDFLHALTLLPEPPYSVPINVLIPIPGTPLEKGEKVSAWEWIRMVATLRIILPKTIIRLAAGRGFFTHTEQLLCFLAGAGSIHIGEKLLTAPNCTSKDDEKLLELLFKS